MSQVTEQSVRFQTALASIKLIQASAVLDLTEDDFDFLTSNKVWIDRKSGSAGMPRPISYAVFCLKKQSIIGHFHIKTNKTDPGPAFQWDYVIRNARRLLNGGRTEAAAS